MRATEPPRSDQPSSGPEPGPAAATGPAARRAPAGVARRPGLLTSAALLAVAAVLLTAGWASRQDRPAGDRTVGEVTRVGIASGDPIPGYLRAAAAELAALPAGGSPAGTYALVSFSAYVAPGGLAALLDGVSVAEVVARVPLPGRQSEIVRLPVQWLPQDVTAGMAGVAARKDREAADQRARAAGAADPELRRGYETGAQVAADEAAAYRAGCACLYAAMVRGVPEALRVLAGRPGSGPSNLPRSCAGWTARWSPHRCPNSATWPARRPTPGRCRGWAKRRKRHRRLWCRHRLSARRRPGGPAERRDLAVRGRRRPGGGASVTKTDQNVRRPVWSE